MYKTLTQVGLFLVLVIVLVVTFYEYFYVQENNLKKIEKISPDIDETIIKKKIIENTYIM